MPINRRTVDTNVSRAKAWLKEHKPDYHVTYAVLKEAMLADGIVPRGLHPDVTEPRNFDAVQQAAYTSAKTALGLEG